MKVLITTGIFPPDIGGPAVYAQKLAEEFYRRGISTAVLTYGNNVAASFSYPLFRVSRKWPIGLRQAIYFWKIIRQSRHWDVILSLDSLGAGLPAIIAGKIFHKKVIIRMGGDFLWEKYIETGRGQVTMTEFYNRKLNWHYPALNYLIMLVLRLADYVAFTTNFQRNLFIANYGIKEKQSVVISNIFEKGVGLTSLRQGGIKTILWAGRFLKLKNLDYLLKSFKRLLEQDNSLLLKLVGDGPELKKLKVESEKLKVKGKILFLGLLSRDALAEEIKKSYLCVLPSLSDISPNFILECLSLNKAVVLTQETGIKDQFPGLIYIDPKNKSSFFEAAVKLLNIKEYNNYQHFISNIHYRKTWADLAGEYLKLSQL